MRSGVSKQSDVTYVVNKQRGKLLNRTAILLMIITVFSKICGFLRDIILSYYYGTSGISDAYIISLSIPLALFGFIGAATSTGYIPLYTKIERTCGTEEAVQFTNNLINWLLVFCTVIVILGIFFTESIVKIFAIGFRGETLRLAVQFTQISILSIYFIGLLYVYSDFLQVKGKYIVPAALGLPLNLIIILSIIISFYTHIIVLAIGSTLAIAFQLALLVPYIYQQGYRYKFKLDIKDKNIKSMLYTAVPVMVGIAANQINVIVDRTIASQLVIGGISALSYAIKLTGAIQSIFVLPIVAVMYPMISRMVAENNLDSLKKAIARAIGSANLLIIPITVGVMIFAEPVVRLLFERGAFDTQALAMTSSALFFYSIGMIGYGLREIVARAFYSLHDTKTPMINGAIAMIINIVLNVILSVYLGINGLALATSISAIVCTILLCIQLKNKIGSFGLANVMASSTKILLASICMGIIAKLAYNILLYIFGLSLALLFSIGIGIIIYSVLIYFLRIEDAETIVLILKRKISKIRFRL